MKRLFSLVFVCIIGCVLNHAQEIKPIAAVADDYIPLLNAAGFEAFPFDISSLSDQNCYIILSIKEYEHDQLVKEDYLGWPIVTGNMRMVSEFPKESQETIRPEEMDDPERGIYRLAKKLQIGFLPVENDTLRTVQISVEKMMTMTPSLKMKPQYVDNDTINGKKMYSYLTRPFKIEGLKMNTFIPLVLLGSMWYDEQFKIHRFCGENEIDPDMSSKMLKYIPHYYVIGVEIKPKDEN